MNSANLALKGCVTSVLLACSGGQEPGLDTADTDSGLQPLTYQEFLLDWYADYDAGQGLEYLDQTGEWERDQGDSVTYDVLRDAAYGPHGERTTMDVYLPTGAENAPVVVFIHGGGFRSKNKDNLLDDNERIQVAGRFLQAGFAVASINYRYRSDGLEETVLEPDWECSGESDEDGCRLDVIYRDGARAVQYLRYRSEELKIDPDRIGAWGRSAGGQIVTWIGLVPDLAVADHEDPVLRQSTSLQAIGHTNSQVTGPSHLWPEHVSFASSGDCEMEDLWDRLRVIKGETGYNQSLQSTLQDLDDTSAGQDLIRVVHFLDAMGPEDPPFLTSSPVRDYTCEELMQMSDDDFQGSVLHHPRHSEPLMERCEEVGVGTCEKITALGNTFSDDEDGYKEEEELMRQFMVEWL